MSISTYLIGPISYTELKSERYDKHIILLGDQHCFDVTCPANSGAKLIPVDQWIHQQVKKARTDTIDLFLECGFRNKQYECLDQGNCFIKNVYHRFSEALTIDKSRSPYKNLRAHYTDIRIFKHPVIERLREIERFIDIVDDKPYVLTEWMKFTDKQRIQGLQIPSFLEIIQSCKIKRQLDNIGDSAISWKIHDLYKDLYENSMIYRKFTVIQKILLSVSDSVVKNIGDINPADIDPYIFTSHLTRKQTRIISRASRSIIKTLAHLMDAYVLGRIFRSYTDGKHISASGGLLKDNLDSKYIIVYTGNDHTLQYIKVLRDVIGDFQILTHKTSDIEEVDFQCINITQSSAEYIFKNQ